MTNSLHLGGIYILFAVMLVLGILFSRQEPTARRMTTVLAAIAIFGAGFVLFTFRDDFGWVAQRLKAEAVGTPVTAGQETRIPMAVDGHFWVDAKVNGRDVRFLVDSGATLTTIGHSIAAGAGVTMSRRPDGFVRTGNGVIRVSSGRAREIVIGDIVRRDVALQVADNEDINVLGMNYLSTLKRWGVEGRWLILVS